MSGFESIIPMAATAIGTVASTASANSAQTAAANAQNDAITRRNQLIATQQAQQDQQQLNLLDQQQASARAQMGAWGTAGDGGGSADAILAGMAQRTADSIASGNQTAAMKLQNRTNLLSSNSGSNGLDVFQSFLGNGGGSATDALSMLD